LAKQPQERFPSILAFAEALQRALDASTGDLQASLAISLEEAEHGTTRTITLPTGRTLTVTIPPKVQDGHLIFLAGEGERELESGQRGNVLLTVMVNRESKFLPDKEVMERTGRTKPIEDGNNPPIFSSTAPAVPGRRSDSGGIERVWSP